MTEPQQNSLRIYSTKNGCFWVDSLHLQSLWPIVCHLRTMAKRILLPRQSISVCWPDSGQIYIIVIDFWGLNCRRLSCEKYLAVGSEERWLHLQAKCISPWFVVSIFRYCFVGWLKKYIVVIDCKRLLKYMWLTTEVKKIHYQIAKTTELAFHIIFLKPQ